MREKEKRGSLTASLTHPTAPHIQFHFKSISLYSGDRVHSLEAS